MKNYIYEQVYDFKLALCLHWDGIGLGDGNFWGIQKFHKITYGQDLSWMIFQ